jgi:hypothetical protein
MRLILEREKGKNPDPDPDEPYAEIGTLTFEDSVKHYHCAGYRQFVQYRPGQFSMYECLY